MFARSGDFVDDWPRFVARSTEYRFVVGPRFVAFVVAAFLLATSTAEASAKTEIRGVFREWITAIRHHQGQDACVLMTRRLYRMLRKAYDPFYSTDNCREFIDSYGGRVRHDVSGRLEPIKVRGRRAWAGAVRSDGGYWFVRDGGEWYVHYPPRSEWHRYPGGPDGLTVR